MYQTTATVLAVLKAKKAPLSIYQLKKQQVLRNVSERELGACLALLVQKGQAKPGPSNPARTWEAV